MTLLMIPDKWRKQQSRIHLIHLATLRHEENRHFRINFLCSSAEGIRTKSIQK